MEPALLVITQEIRGESSELSCLYNLVSASKLETHGLMPSKDVRAMGGVDLDRLMN